MEIWKDIEDYERLYQVSNLGNVKSKKRNKLLKPYTTSNDYLVVKLSHNNKQINYFVHRLVAKAFIPNPENKPQVNHKDENIQNNNANNLEWCTHSYNQNYGKRNKRVQEKLGIKINQYDLKGNYIKTFNSITEAQKKCNTTHINECLSGKLKQTGGYIWKYAEILKGDKETPDLFEDVNTITKTPPVPKNMDTSHLQAFLEELEGDKE